MFRDATFTAPLAGFLNLEERFPEGDGEKMTMRETKDGQDYPKGVNLTWGGLLFELQAMYETFWMKVS